VTDQHISKQMIVDDGISERTVATDTGPVPAISQISSASARPQLSAS
jgi:hypothetical protein